MENNTQLHTVSRNAYHVQSCKSVSRLMLSLITHQSYHTQGSPIMTLVNFENIIHPFFPCTHIIINLNIVQNEHSGPSVPDIWAERALEHGLLGVVSAQKGETNYYQIWTNSK